MADKTLSRAPNIPPAEFAEIIQRIPSVIIEVVAFDMRNRIALVKRGYEPFKGAWHLPGGFLGFDEPLGEAAARIARVETGLAVSGFHELGFWDYRGLDPRGRQIALGFWGWARPDDDEAPVGPSRLRARAGEEVAWFDKLPAGFLDHQRPLIAAARRCIGARGDI